MSWMKLSGLTGPFDDDWGDDMFGPDRAVDQEEQDGGFDHSSAPVDGDEDGYDTRGVAGQRLQRRDRSHTFAVGDKVLVHEKAGGLDGVFHGRVNRVHRLYNRYDVILQGGIFEANVEGGRLAAPHGGWSGVVWCRVVRCDVV